MPQADRNANLRCAVCHALRGERREILIGPSAAICDVCVNAANREERPANPAAEGCSFCGDGTQLLAHRWEVDGPGASPWRLCVICLDLFNQVLFEAAGPDALEPLVRQQVERAYRQRMRETDRLELDILDRRSRSVKQELLQVNLELLLRNVETMLEETARPEDGPFRGQPLPLRRRAVKLLADLARRIELSLPGPVRPGALEEE